MTESSTTSTRRRGRVRLRALGRAFFAPRLLLHRSTGADVLYFFVNVYATVLFIGWACLSAGAVAA